MCGHCTSNHRRSSLRTRTCLARERSASPSSDAIESSPVAIANRIGLRFESFFLLLFAHHRLTIGDLRGDRQGGEEHGQTSKKVQGSRDGKQPPKNNQSRKEEEEEEQTLSMASLLVLMSVEKDDENQCAHFEQNQFFCHCEGPRDRSNVFQDQIGQGWKGFGIGQTFIDDGDDEGAAEDRGENEEKGHEGLLAIGTNGSEIAAATVMSVIFDLDGARFRLQMG